MGAIAEVDNLENIPAYKEVSIVINFETKIYSSLAIASALKFIKCPIIIIDCFSEDGSLDFFKNVFSTPEHNVYIVEMPLNIHGLTLDSIFKEIKSELVWLIDSDLEILKADIILEMRAGISESAENYGAGLLQQSCWLGPPYHNYPPNTYYYYERPFVPLTLLKTEKINQLLLSGSSFAAKRVFNETSNHTISKFLSHRFKLPLLKKVKKIGASRSDLPLIEEFDTAADLHKSATTSGLSFHKIDDRFWGDIFHFNGITRSKKAGAIYRLFCSLKLISQSQCSEYSNNLEKAKERLRLHFPSI